MPLARTYQVETARTIIRCYQPSDAEMLRLSINESIEHLRPWMPWIKHEPQTLEQKVDLLRTFRGQFDMGIDYTFGIFNKEETELIGSTGMHTRLEGNARELGYWINVRHINHGYATEAMKALIKVGFEIEMLDRLEIRCDPRNVQSQNIPQKLGFNLDGILNDHLVDGVQRNTMVWLMTKEMYAQNAIKKFPLKAFDAAGKQLM